MPGQARWPEVPQRTLAPKVRAAANPAALELPVHLLKLPQRWTGERVQARLVPAEQAAQRRRLRSPGKPLACSQGKELQSLAAEYFAQVPRIRRPAPPIEG
ncbi:MAG TPA: hypothetical protein VLC74_05305 [Rhizomicrobium sp.]|nr:hypothetical protein [Rhizomicrobium sp.]